MNKKITICTVACAMTAMTAVAEGYQINTLSTKQLGMASTGTALTLGAENMFFNPAGMAYMDKALDITGSFVANMPKVTATVGAQDYKSKSQVATPMMFNAGFSIYKNLKAGVSFYTPYGSSIDWGQNWPGATLNQNVKLKVFTVQPTVSWAITDRLSIGAGAMVSWGSVNLNKGLIPAASFDGMLQTMGIPDNAPGVTPVSVQLEGKAKVVCGLNVGAMFRLNKQLSFGANFRTKMSMKVEAGDARVTYARPMAEKMLSETLLPISESQFAAEMPAPWTLSLGVGYKPIDNLTLAFDARLTGWNAYKQLDIAFDNASAFDQHIVKDYKNSWAFSVGAQYGLTGRFDLRAGVMVDTSPVNDQHYNPETPGMTKIEPTVGLSFRPVKNLSIDFAFMYVAGMGKKGVSCEYTDMLTQKAMQFTADYKLHAFIPSIGLSFSY